MSFGVFLSFSSMLSATKKRAEIIQALGSPFARVRRDLPRQGGAERERVLHERLPRRHTTAERASHSVDVRGAGVAAVLAAFRRLLHLYVRKDHDSCRFGSRVLLTDVESDRAVTEVAIDRKSTR